MPALLIVPVTATLKADLVNAGSVLDAVDPTTLNDLANFGNLVSLLDTIARSVLTASASGPLTNDVSNAARFNMGPDTELSDVLAGAVAYLRGPAATALAGPLDPVTHALCDAAWIQIGLLFHAVMDAIARIAGIDLEAVHGNGAGNLIDAATLLAQAAHA